MLKRDIIVDFLNFFPDKVNTLYNATELCFLVGSLKSWTKIQLKLILKFFLVILFHVKEIVSGEIKYF
ncbi:unnamed protein product [Meloidogyne enterolobii]|uniref:Uncharacterized protein n=1 Tax=Meloidogyne enterolobii TaxID=390850 RepID=A0ACB0XX61_MELEN